MHHQARTRAAVTVGGALATRPVAPNIGDRDRRPTAGSGTETGTSCSATSVHGLRRDATDRQVARRPPSHYVPWQLLRASLSARRRASGRRYGPGISVTKAAASRGPTPTDVTQSGLVAERPRVAAIA